MKYVVLEEEILYNHNLTSTEKIILAIIKGLEQTGEPVYATNKYFASVVGIEERQVSRIINKLIEMKIILAHYEKNKSRRLASTKEVISKYSHLFYEESKKIIEYEEEEDYNWLLED